MEQYPGDGSPAEADSSPDGDDLSRLRRVGRLFGRLAGRDALMGTVEFQAVAAPKKDSKPKLQDPYPEPMRPGGAAYGSGAPFSADWRKNLPIGDPDRPKDPSEFITHDDPEYRAVLRLLMQVPIDKR